MGTRVPDVKKRTSSTIEVFGGKATKKGDMRGTCGVRVLLGRARGTHVVTLGKSPVEEDLRFANVTFAHFYL